MATVNIRFDRTLVALMAPVGIGVVVGLLIAWLKKSYGVSPYWFIAVATCVAVLITVASTLSFTRRDQPLFIFDWVASVEGIMGFALMSAMGLVTIASLVLSGWVFFLIIIVFAGLLFALITYVFKNSPGATEDDDDTL